MFKPKSLPYRQGNSIVIYDASLIESIKIWRVLGFSLLTLSFFCLFLLFGPVLISEFSFRLNPPPVLKTSLQVKGNLPPKSEIFKLVIPKINVEAKVIPSVDPTNQKEYEAALKNGVAQAKGTFFPGEGNLIYLFGHSTDYLFNVKNFNALFYRLNDLSLGDQINLDYNGKLFHYKVSNKKFVSPDDLSAFTPTNNQEKLILQTCWPPGTTWQRLLIIADPV